MDEYLATAKMLKPALERVEGFVDNIRYRSLTREGWIVSLSGWRDEKSLIRWRTDAIHHGAQEKGRAEIFRDYRLRVGQVTRDTQLPAGQALDEQRLDETETKGGTAVILVNASHSPEQAEKTGADARAAWLGLLPQTAGLVGWDVFDAVLAPGDYILLTSWRDKNAAEAFEAAARPPTGARVRRIRIIRDYGMFDRRESPQYYPQVARTSP